MVLKNVLFFWVLLFAHLVGDFYVQTETLAQEKKRKASALIQHCIIYGACVLTAALALCGRAAFYGGTAAALGHAAIDGAKFYFPHRLKSLKTKMERRKGWVLAADQMLHLVVLTAAVLLWPAPILPWVSELLTVLSCIYSLSGILRLGCLLLFLGKPANITLKLCNCKPDTGETPTADGQKTAAADRRAGAVIGTLERLLTAVLFLLDQYGAISVVFAGKTLTRYQRIVENSEFGEYYLTGTLGSLLLAVLSTMLLFPPVR